MPASLVAKPGCGSLSHLTKFVRLDEAVPWEQAQLSGGFRDSSAPGGDAGIQAGSEAESGTPTALVYLGPGVTVVPPAGSFRPELILIPGPRPRPPPPSTYIVTLFGNRMVFAEDRVKVRSLRRSLTQHDRCPPQKGGNLGTETDTQGRPCEDTGRRRPSAHQGTPEATSSRGTGLAQIVLPSPRRGQPCRHPASRTKNISLLCGGPNLRSFVLGPSGN